jgi:transcriptional regulator
MKPLQKDATLAKIRDYGLKVSEVASICGLLPARVSEYYRMCPIKPNIAEQIEQAIDKLCTVRDYFAPYRIDVRTGDELERLYREALTVSQIDPAQAQAILSSAARVARILADMEIAHRVDKLIEGGLTAQLQKALKMALDVAEAESGLDSLARSETEQSILESKQILSESTANG